MDTTPTTQFNPHFTDMLHFTAFFSQEKPRIAKAVDMLTAGMPEHVRPAVAYALSTGGKRLRPLLAVLSARALGYTGNTVYALGATLEMFHVATLLHDDILDNADVRRAHPATHLKFGVPRTLLAADAMVSLCFQRLAETDDPRFMQCLARAVIGTANGEIAEIESVGRTDGGITAYTSIVEGKTACLLRASCELGALCATKDESVVAIIGTFGLNLGMAFQIIDDVLDFAHESVTGKPSGGDVREGKFTPPVAFYLESLTERKREDFLRRFKEHDFSDSELAAVVDAVNRGGFATRAMSLANAYLDAARKALDMLPSSPAASGKARAALSEALMFVRDRTA